MNVVYHLKERTVFIRSYYDQCVDPFARTKQRIENKLPPFDTAPYSEDPEPPYLDEWFNAETGIQIVGLSCVSLLSNSLKLYFDSLRHRVIGFGFGDEECKRRAFKDGFVAAYKSALSYILDTDWSDCPANFEVIEQVVLARNCGQHGSDFTSFRVSHDEHTLRKHPRPFFVSEQERELWMKEEVSASSWFLMPDVYVTREALFTAIENVERLADWIDGRMHKVGDWRMGSRQPS